MLFPTFVRDANKTATTLMQAAFDNMRATQETMERQRELATKMEMPWKVSWSKGPMPMPNVSYTASSADSTREAFHLMADANMKAWENAAVAYAALPGWMKMPYKMPGKFWSKWFDQWQDGKFDAMSPAGMDTVMETITAAAKKCADQVELVMTPPEAAAEEPVEDAAEAAVEEVVEAFKDVEETAEEIVEDTVETVSDMPMLLEAAEGEADDLTQIKGIGPKLSAVLNDKGIYHFSQIAGWTPENIAWLDEKLSFKGRVQREGWVEQAQNLLKLSA